MKDKINNLMNSEKGPTKIKLTLYMFFLLLVVLFILASGGFDKSTQERSARTTKDTKIEEPLSFDDKQKKLLTEDYSYVITVNNTIVFNGKKENGIDTGYKETSKEIIKYKITDGIVYKVSGMTEEVYNNLYDDVNESLLSLKSVFDKLNSTSAIITRSDIETIYEYEVDNENYKIYTDNKTINKIEIKFGEQTYIFEFNY